MKTKKTSEFEKDRTATTRRWFVIVRGEQSTSRKTKWWLTTLLTLYRLLLLCTYTKNKIAARNICMSKENSVSFPATNWQKFGYTRACVLWGHAKVARPRVVLRATQIITRFITRDPLGEEEREGWTASCLSHTLTYNIHCRRNGQSTMRVRQTHT